MLNTHRKRQYEAVDVVQVAELLPCMVEQMQGLCLVANEQLPRLGRASSLPAPALAIVQDCSRTAHAAVQAFVELCG